MADIANKPNCGGSTSTFNSGLPLCDVIRKAPKALLLLDSGVEFTPSDRADIATLVAAIKTKTRAARGARVYPITSLSGFTDNSKASTKAAIGNLSIQEITMQEGIPSFTFEHYKGDLFQKQLSKAEGGSLKLMILDAGNVLYGTETSSGNLTGFTLAEFKAELPKFATASNPAVYPFAITLDSIIEYRDNLMIAQLDSSVYGISGIVDADLNSSDNPPVQVLNVINIAPIGTGGKNVGALYPSALAVVGAWVATNVQTGASFTITSVSWDETAQKFIITLDTTAYAALSSGDEVNVSLASAAALLALGIDGFESVGPVVVVKA